MTNYEASKASDRVVIFRCTKNKYIAYYATRNGDRLGQAYEGASIGAAVRALENSADEDGTHADDAPWRAQAAFNPEFRGAARARAGEDY